MKVCNKCGKSKYLCEFRFRKDTNKYRNACKECVKKQDKMRYLKNRDNIQKKARIRNTDPSISKGNVERVRRWRNNNPDKYKENNVKWTQRKRQKRKDDSEFRERGNKQSIEWRKNNPDKARDIKKRQRGRVEVKIADNLRRRINLALKNGQKNGSAVKDLGCSVNDFKTYLEDRFYPHPKTGEMMDWKNYGLYGWHLDHIVPLVSFNLEDREEFLEAAHYTNIQPMWAEENLRKGSKLE